jgi:Tfp pilus assembly protein PilO
MPILLVLLLAGSIAGGGWFYYTDTQARIAQLQANNAELKLANAQNLATIDSMENQAEINAELNEELQERLEESEESRNRLIEVFGKHDLTRLALKKPGLIETRVNNGTKKAFDAIESVSGAPTNDGVQSPQ